MVWAGLGGLGGYTGAFRISLGTSQRQCFLVLFQAWWNCLLAGSPTACSSQPRTVLPLPSRTPPRWQEASCYLLVDLSLSLGCPCCTFWPSCSSPPLWNISSNFHGPSYILLYLCMFCKLVKSFKCLKFLFYFRNRVLLTAAGLKLANLCIPERPPVSCLLPPKRQWLQVFITSQL